VEFEKRRRIFARPQPLCQLVLEVSQVASLNPRFFGSSLTCIELLQAYHEMLPTAGVNRVFGLLDLLRAYNGKTDVANLTIDLRIALDELLPIIDTAEYLGLVAVQQGDISLTDLGKKALNGKIPERKKIVHDRLVGLEPFADIVRMVHEKKQLSRFELARFLSSKFGYTTDLPTIINVLISWGVFAGLLRYDGQSESLLPRE